jgi:hypothetical protein
MQAGQEGLALQAGTELDVKRFYLPGARVVDDCPECGAEVTRDMGKNYLSHPKLGVPADVHMYCDECEHEWDVGIVVEVTVRLAPGQED